MYDRKNFSERIKELRISRNETQKEFAKFVNSTAATISAYENGTKNPSLEVVANIASSCNVTVDWLCGLSDKKQNKLETYSDILKLMYELSLDDYKAILKFKIYINLDRELKIASINFDFDDEIFKILEDFQKIYDLFKSNTIDEEMYRVLIENLSNKHNNSIKQYDI